MGKKNITEYTTSSGEKRFRVRVRQKGVYLNKNFKTKTHALQWLQKEERKLTAAAELGVLAKSDYSTKTVKDAVEAYRTFRLPSITSKGSVTPMLNEIERLLGNKKLNDVEHDDVFLAVQEYRKGGRGGRGEMSANRFVNLLATVFTEARRKKWTNNKPTQFFKRYNEEKYQRTRSLSKEEEALLIKESEHNLYPNSATAIWIAILTGYRKDWIRHMKWEYIDFEKRFIRLPMGKINPRGESGKNTAKGVPIVAKLYEVLKKHRAMLLAAGVESPYVFPRSDDPNKTWDVRRGYVNATKRAGIKDLRFHDLRHTAATNLVMKGVHQRVIAEMLGHKDPRSTQRYTHVPTEHMRSELERAFTYSDEGDDNETA